MKKKTVITLIYALIFVVILIIAIVYILLKSYIDRRDLICTKEFGTDSFGTKSVREEIITFDKTGKRKTYKEKERFILSDTGLIEKYLQMNENYYVEDNDIVYESETYNYSSDLEKISRKQIKMEYENEGYKCN